ISTPSGASSRAARARAVLYDSSRRLPERARIFTSGRPDRREGGLQRDVVREQETASGKGRVPVEAELRAVDLPLELETETVVAGHVGARAEERASQLDRLRRALDGEIAADDDVVAVDLDLGRSEMKLREALGVEEVG